MTHKATPSTQVIAYHGSGCSIEQFDYAFTGIGHDQNGSGFYFSTSINDAIGYTEREVGSGVNKPGGQESPTIHVAQLSFEGLLEHDAFLPISQAQVIKMLAYAKDVDHTLWNWGDLSVEDRTSVLMHAASHYTHKHHDMPVLRTLFSMANDFFDGDTESFNRAMKDVLGIDGVVEHYPDRSHYVVFFPAQIQVLARLTPQEARARDEAEMQDQTEQKPSTQRQGV